MYKLKFSDLKGLLLAQKFILKDRIAWIDQGSLLGLIRDKQFIEWDNDIDLSCHYTEKPDIRLADVKKLLEYGFVVVTSKYDITLKSLNDKAKTKKIDITYIHRQNGRYVKSYSDYKHQNIVAKLFEKTIKEGTDLLRSVRKPAPRLFLWMIVNAVTYTYRSYVMKTVRMTCPEWQFELHKEPLLANLNAIYIYKEPENYLEYKFGPDWRTPKRDWDYTSEDGAVMSTTTEQLA